VLNNIIYCTLFNFFTQRILLLIIFFSLRLLDEAYILSTNIESFLLLNYVLILSYNRVNTLVLIVESPHFCNAKITYLKYLLFLIMSSKFLRLSMIKCLDNGLHYLTHKLIILAPMCFAHIIVILSLFCFKNVLMNFSIADLSLDPDLRYFLVCSLRFSYFDVTSIFKDCFLEVFYFALESLLLKFLFLLSVL